MGRKRGEEKKVGGRQGGIVSRARLLTLESLPRETKGGGRCQLSSKLRELLMPMQK